MAVLSTYADCCAVVELHKHPAHLDPNKHFLVFSSAKLLFGVWFIVLLFFDFEAVWGVPTSCIEMWFIALGLAFWWEVAEEGGYKYLFMFSWALYWFFFFLLSSGALIARWQRMLFSADFLQIEANNIYIKGKIFIRYFTTQCPTDEKIKTKTKCCGFFTQLLCKQSRKRNANLQEPQRRVSGSNLFRVREKQTKYNPQLRRLSLDCWNWHKNALFKKKKKKVDWIWNRSADQVCPFLFKRDRFKDTNWAQSKTHTH